MSHPRRALITGATGFVGSHLIEYLLAETDDAVFACRRSRSNLENVAHLSDPRLTWVETEITDSLSMDQAISDTRPDAVFHLAAISFVPQSWREPEQTFRVNTQGTINLLESVRRYVRNGGETRVLIIGSSEEYGLVFPNEVPITEDNPLRPLSPYGVSKVAEDLLGFQYHRSYGLHIVRSRAFNHTGPRRGAQFATSNFAFQVAECEAGVREPVIRVGNLEAKRDFTDVRDIVRGYHLAVLKGEPGEVYNLCSGRSVSLRWVLDTLLARSRVKPRIEVDPDRLRPSDVPILQGDHNKFTKATGWEPKIPLEQTLADLLDYWRGKVKKGA